MKSLKLYPNEAERGDFRDSNGDLIADGPTQLLLDHCLKQVPQGGFSLDEMEARLAVKAALRAAAVAAASELLLEDSAAATLVRVVNAAKWGGMSELIPVFVRAVREMPTVAVKRAE